MSTAQKQLPTRQTAPKTGSKTDIPLKNAVGRTKLNEKKRTIDTKVPKSDSSATLNEPSIDFMSLLDDKAIVIQKWWLGVRRRRTDFEGEVDNVQASVTKRKEEEIVLKDAATERRQQRALKARMVLIINTRKS